MSAPVDVLAVMEREMGRIDRAYNRPGDVDPAADLRKARDAVAGMIEAIQSIASSTASNHGYDLKEAACWAQETARATLARCKGGAA